MQKTKRRKNMKKRILPIILSLLVVVNSFLPAIGSIAADSGEQEILYDYEKVAVTNPTANTWYVTSGSTGDGGADWAFDGNGSTWWHTNWGTATTENPLSGSMTWTAVTDVPAYADVAGSRAWIGGEFGEAITLGKFTYEGRTDKAANWFGQYALYTANVTEGEVTDADFTLAYTATNSGSSKVTAELDSPVTATHFRLVAFTATSDVFVTASEIEMFEATPTDTTPRFTGSIVDIDTQYTQDRIDEVKKLNTTSASLSAWKNDKALSEISLCAMFAAYEDVTVTASDLTSGNNTISKDNVTATFIKSTKAYNGGYLGYGSTTRPIPADDGSNRSESNDILYQTTPVDMAKNTLQNVWVEFAIPEDAAAGTYTGTITVTAKDLAEPMVFTYTVKVFDAVLPDATEFVDGFDIELWQYPYSSAEYYGVTPFSAEHLKLMESSMEIYKEVGGHAITTSIVEEAWSGQTYSANDVHYPSMIKWTKNSDGSFSWDYTDFDAWVTFCKGMGLGDKIVLYSIAPWNNAIGYWENGTLKYQSFSLTNAADQEIWKGFIRNLIEHLMEKGWFDDAYMGIDERGFSKAAFDLIDSVRNIHDIPLKTAGAMDHFVDKWDLALRVTDLNVGDTAAAANPAKFEELLAAREAKGYRTTLYSCTEHQPGQFSLSAPVESYWTVLNAGKMETAGLLRWAYDAWVADPLRDATHNSFEPGDCFLIYPDEKTAANPTSKSSVRLERLAQGVRDNNKLMLMEKEIPSLAADVDAVYANIQYALRTSRSYMSDSQIATLSAETAAFQEDLDALTEKYVALKANGTNEVEAIAIAEGTSMEMQTGNSAQLHVEFTPSNVLNTAVKWTSSNADIVSVDADGQIAAVKEGQAVITATSQLDITKTASITVIVKAVAVDASKQVAYYSFDNVDGTTLKDSWGSRDGVISGSIAEGKDGNALSVTEAGKGATLNGASGLGDAWTISYWVNTTADFTGEISTLEDAEQKYSFSMKMAADRASGFRVGDGSGDVLTLSYNFAPNTWYNLTWTQDKTAGLTLYVNGQKAADNNWTASHAIKAPIDVIGGTGFTGLIDEVKVYNAVLTEAEIAASMLVKGITLSESNLNLYTGNTHKIVATLVSDKEDKTLTYTSSNPAVATVDANGVVTAVGKGTTEIIVKNEAGGYEEKVTVTVKKYLTISNTLPVYNLDDKYLSNVQDPSQDTSHQYFGQPDMVRTSTGRLITSYPMGHGKGPLIMKISDDNGETWTEKTNLPSSWAGSQETPTLYVLKRANGTERIMLITACPGWGTDSDGNQYGWNTSYSDDNGETWTEYAHWHSEAAPGDPNDAIVAMASLIQLKDEDGNYIQKWMGVFHNYGYVNYKTYLTFDENGNEQWSAPVPYLSEYRAIESKYQMCEIGMFRSPDGSRIIGLARSQSHNNPSTLIYSDDEGETWSEPMDLPGTLAGERHKGVYDPISGRLVITFREIQFDLNGNNQFDGGSDWTCNDWGVWVGTYEDLMNQEEGQYRIRIEEDWANNAKSGDTGYAGLVVLEDGTFIMNSYGHWDKDYSLSWGGGVTTDRCYIKQAKFKLGEFENDNNLIDRTALNAYINKVKDTEEADYTAESWTAFEEALAAAQSVNGDDFSAQVQVDAALEALQDAYAALEGKPAVCEHTNTEVKNAKEATCTEAGYTGDTVCKDCQEVVTQGTAIDKKAHTEVTVAGKEATCTETGLTEGKKCSVCNTVTKAQETIAAKGHSFGEWTVVKAPTTEAAGLEERVCACGEKEQREIAKLPAEPEQPVDPEKPGTDDKEDKSPVTGDNAMVLPMVVVMAACVAIVAILKKRLAK